MLDEKGDIVDVIGYISWSYIDTFNIGFYCN